MLRVDSLSFRYNSQSLVLDTLSFQLPRGSHLAVMGESGCGKSTLLQLLYGLHDADTGEIYWDDRLIQGPEYHLVPGMDFMKYLAQDFDLMPYITVSENVGKFLSNFYPEEKKQRISELLETVEMTAWADVKAKDLSGGQMQRVALARVLALEPEVMLLDEPFSHIDNFRKGSLRRKVYSYLKKKKITCITATHDKDDVLPFADEVLIMKEGKIFEKGAPQKVFSTPGSFYTASLFDECNCIPGSFLKLNTPEVQLVYPHQLELIYSPEGNVVVKESFFMGRYYLIEGVTDFGAVFVRHESALPKASRWKLTLRKKTPL